MSESSEGQVTIEEAVPVGHGGDRELLVDIYRPPKHIETRPAVLLIHGGGFQMGDREQLKWYGLMLGRRGYLCVTCEYRLVHEAPWPAQIHDIKTALRWMRASAEELDIDRERIAVWGHSAGAHLALFAAGTQNDRAWEGEGGNAGAGTDVTVAVAYYAPVKLWRSQDSFSPIDILLAGDGSEDAVRAASPLSYVSGSYPPTALLHGSDDVTVPVEQSTLMYEALREAGVPVELLILAGQPHSFDLGRIVGRQGMTTGALFLDRYLAGIVPADGTEVLRRMREIGDADRAARAAAEA